MFVFLHSCPSSSSLPPRMLLVWCLTSATALVTLPPNETVPGVITFGDSIVDTGNNDSLTTLIKCNFLPYGKDFGDGKVLRRESPRRSHWELGIKDVVPAYLDPNITGQDLITGVSFASGGSGFDPLTPKLVSVISLTEQLEYFKEYIGKLRGAAGEEKMNFTLAKSIFLLVAGSDDIANTYSTARVRKLQYDVSTHTDLMAESASNFLQDLYELGARRIAVFSAPAVGCVPSQRTLAGGSMRGCTEDYNQAAQQFNAKISSRINYLNNRLPNSKMVYIDVYTPLLGLILRPQNYGFKVSDKGCCGTGNVEVAILCNQPATSMCTNASDYVFRDGYHPTEKAYETLVVPLNNKYINQFF